MPATPTAGLVLAIGLLLAPVPWVGPGGVAWAQDPSPGTDERSVAASLTPSVSAAPVGSTLPAASTAPIELRPEGTWVATAYDTWGEGLVAPLRGSTLTVSLLPAGRLEGQTGCGAYLGGYSVDGQAIRLGIISTGSGACRPRLDDEAFGFTQALTAVSAWAPGATGIDLLDAEGRVRVVLERTQEAGVVGTWRVDRLADAAGTLADVPDGAEMRLELADDGSVTGSTACRGLQGDYAVEAERIVIAPLTVIGLPCDGPGQRPLRRQESRLLTLLDETVAWRTLAGTLSLVDTSGSVIVELRAEAPAELPMASAPAELPVELPVASARPEPPAASPAPSAG